MKLIIASTFLITAFFAHSQIIINEGSNRNYSTIADEDGEYKDWIELYNPTTDTVSLLNYSLTDNITIPTKWTFPAISILPNEYKLVFCSGKDRKPISGFTHVLTAMNYTPITGWNTHTFTTPFYWDGISNILLNTCSYSSSGYTLNSIFNQTATPFASTSFSFQDNSDAACMHSMGNTANQRPNLKFNTATIGNGTLQNSGTDYPAPYGNWYWGAKHQMLIRASELTAAGLTAGLIHSLSFNVAATDPAMVYDFIEFDLKLVSYNELGSNYESVNPNNFQHTNFTISQSGETIYLFDASQQPLNQLTVGVQNLDESNGLLPDASTNSVIFSSTTAMASNNTSSGLTSYLLPPVFSTQSGIYGTTVNVSISNPNGALGTIYYTLDGSDPTLSSSTFTGVPIPVFYSSVLKARIFGSGYLPSSVTAASYLLGIQHVTPVISIITDNQNLYGSNGIFDNWTEDWQKSAHVSYFSDSSQLIFEQQTGMQIDGGYGGSRSHPQHSFRLELANGTLGEGSVNYPFIPNRPNRTKYSNFYLRNGSNQWLNFPYKDGYQMEAMSATTNNYYSAWRPVTVYINGGYFGLYELREKIDEEYFKTLEGADPDSTDILSLSAWNNSQLRSVIGNPVDTFNVAYDAFNTLNPTQINYWDLADRYFDQTYYVDYVIAESWMGNTDWPQNNIKIMRSNTSGFRYRFCTIDMELAIDPYAWTDCYFDHIAYMMNQSSGNPFINIWLKGIQNNRFKDYFINRFADVMNTAYLPSRLLPLESDFFNQIAIEMQHEYARWGDPNTIPAQMNTLYDSHLEFQDQLAIRSTEVRDDIESNFNLPNQVDLTLDVHPAGAGKIHISTIEPSTYPWNGIYFNGVPVKIEAIANFGYNFSNWGTNSIISDVLNPVFLDTLACNSIQFDAYFTESQASTSDLTANNPSFNAYPNPTSNIVTIVALTPELAQFNYQIVDLSGRVLQTNSLNTQGVETNVSLSNLPNSIYLIRILDGTIIKQQLRVAKVGN
jgi:hypothetical protein